MWTGSHVSPRLLKDKRIRDDYGGECIGAEFRNNRHRNESSD
jgi:hypothetical protein